MTKVEYLAKLDRYLRKLPKDDYQEAMDYFREYFDEAGPENEEAVIAELGTPKRLLVILSAVCLMRKSLMQMLLKRLKNGEQWFGLLV